MATAAETEPRIHDPHTVDKYEAADAEKKDSTSDLEPRHKENPMAEVDSEADKLHYQKYGTYDRCECLRPV